MRQCDLFPDELDKIDILSKEFSPATVKDRLSLLRYLSDWHTEITSEILDHRRQINRLELGGWGAMELKTNVSRIRVRFTRQRLRINEL